MTQELQDALAITPDTTEFDDNTLTDVEYLISVWAGTVTIDLERNIIRLVHSTIQEYLERVRESWLPHVEERIVTTCLDYISLAVSARGCDIEILMSWLHLRPISRRSRVPHMQSRAFACIHDLTSEHGPNISHVNLAQPDHISDNRRKTMLLLIMFIYFLINSIAISSLSTLCLLAISHSLSII